MNAGIRVMLIDDHQMVREGITALIQQRANYRVVAETADADVALRMAAQSRPDIVLMETILAGVCNLALIRGLVLHNPACAVVILSRFDGDEDIFRGLNSGARGYLLKNSTATELWQCLETVTCGRRYISPTVGEKLAQRINCDGLTQRETEILHMVSEGKANKRIARNLSITEGTVKTHMKSILGKLNAVSRTEAVSIGIRRGLIHM